MFTLAKTKFILIIKSWKGELKHNLNLIKRQLPNIQNPKKTIQFNYTSQINWDISIALEQRKKMSVKYKDNIRIEIWTALRQQVSESINCSLRNCEVCLIYGRYAQTFPVVKAYVYL